MTVQQLIDKLSKHNPNLPVYICDDGSSSPSPLTQLNYGKGRKCEPDYPNLPERVQVDCFYDEGTPDDDTIDEDYDEEDN